MSLGQEIIDAIERRRDVQRRNQPGAVGQFWREGGKGLLYDLPVATGGLIIDAGGYKGEWSAGMISRYGCRSQVFEPMPEFYEHCRAYFKNNTMVHVHKAALGGSDRKTTFNFLDNGTSEYRSDNAAKRFESEVVDISRIFAELGTRIGCLKLNVEGGEYEVLEKMLETNNVSLCDSLLIQFHRQPKGYESRYKNIVSALKNTHTQIWCYEMVWEKWVHKDSQA
jgi:FkbM family methyltransferase